MMETKKVQTLEAHWKLVSKDYKLRLSKGKGAYGEVVLAKSRATNEKVAIKYIPVNFSKAQDLKALLRELTILRQLSEMSNNVFTTKLHSVVLNKSREQAFEQS
jgi:serine/threonine protein kinase